MSKAKQNQRRQRPRPTSQKQGKSIPPARKERGSLAHSRATRETIESIVLAVILAFIFRSFEAEAFVIPTGSMASTLMARLVDVFCDECGYRYSSGASAENPGAPIPGIVIQTTCPICRYPKTLARQENEEFKGKPNPNEASFEGDRLIVDKVTYLLSDPQRWDVIVFKYPYNPKQNYIKRLVGLPGETIRIQNGDIFAKQAGASEFKICRKPPHKLRAFLQIVDDTNHIPTAVIQSKGPSRWQQWSKPESDRLWKISRDENSETYAIKNPSDQIAWLRYRHLLPLLDPRVQPTSAGPKRVTELASFKWSLPDNDSDLRGQLITDFYAYNQNVLELKQPEQYRRANERGEVEDVVQKDHISVEPGYHWAGDLAVECDVNIESKTGDLLLQLVEGGIKYTCTIDVATGQATLSISDESMTFIDDDRKEEKTVSAETKVRGPGRYQLRFANADDELTLWVDEQAVEFDHPARFQSPADLSPKWTEDDPLDAEPVGIGSRNCAMTVNRLRVLRDIYYHAIKSDGLPLFGIESMDYDPARFERYSDQYDEKVEQYRQSATEREILLSQPVIDDEAITQVRELEKTMQRLELEIQAAVKGPMEELRSILLNPQTWNSTDLFTTRRSEQFNLEEGQYFPMGDNSPSSKDARLWGPEHYVDEDLLIGKAQFVFWPHGWARPVPYWPNFDRFRFVR